MSAIHGIHDIWEVEAGKFFRYAQRLPAYRGVMRIHAEQQAQRQHRRTGGAKVIPLTSTAQLAADDGLAGLVDIG